VIIAFPQTAITTNAKAVLPLAVYNSGRFNDVLSADSFNGTKTTTLSTAAYNSAKGAFSCKLINYNYFGPVMTLRHSLDTNGYYTQNFYADVCGNLGTTYMGTGTSVSAWLTATGANTTYAYVTKWYNQAMDICFNSWSGLYQPGNQPIYDVANGLINFGYTSSGAYGSGWTANAGNALMTCAFGALPYNDSSYTISLMHGNYPGNNTYFIQGGAYVSNQNNIVFINSSGQYANSWAIGTDSTTGAAAANSVITAKYTSGTANSRIIYKNGTGSATNASGRAQPGGTNGGFNWLGIAQNQGYCNSQLYYLYYFSTALGNATSTTSSGDQSLIEATPYTYTAPAAITLTVASVTTTNFVLSTSTVTGANQFMVYINGSATYTSATGLTALSSVTVTPGVSGPWAVYVYAYNSGYALLASGSAYPATMRISSSSWDTNGFSGVTSGGYTLYGIKTAATSYTMTVTVNSPTTMYLFMVGGGGAGGNDIGGGGGGGEVIPTAITLPVGSSYTLTFNVGVGGSGGGSNNGGNTYISGLPANTFISNYPVTSRYTTASTTTITAYGGGYGGLYGNNTSGSIGGSSGGVGAYNSSASSTAVVSVNPNFTFLNNAYAGGNNNSYKLAAGGGGAGGVGGNVVNSGTTKAGNGGIGIQCTLPGISTYSPSGTTYGTYYWGGGGGGGGNNDGSSGTGGYGGNGGNGGGGGGGVYSSSTAGTGGAGLNNGSTGTVISSQAGSAGGAGGANTGGGGGGGSGYGGAGGAGGSGIILIAFANGSLY
jgi:hypothetical protein